MSLSPSRIYGSIGQLGAANKANTFNLTIVTTTPAQTVTIAQLTPTGDSTTIDWGDGVIDVIANGRTTAITHVYTTAGTYACKVAKPEIVIRLNLQAASVASCSVGNIRKLSRLTYLNLNSLAGITVGAGEIGALTSIMSITLAGCAGITVGAGEIGVLANLTYLYLYNLTGVTVGTGEIGALTSMVNLYLINCAGIAATTGISALTKFKAGQYENNLTQAQVDALLAAMYAARANYILTGATPTLDLLGTGNAVPSGIHQDTSPPTTGKEFSWQLEHGGGGTWKNWVITTA